MPGAPPERLSSAAQPAKQTVGRSENHHSGPGPLQPKLRFGQLSILETFPFSLLRLASHLVKPCPVFEFPMAAVIEGYSIQRLTDLGMEPFQGVLYALSLEYQISRARWSEPTIRKV